MERSEGGREKEKKKREGGKWEGEVREGGEERREERGKDAKNEKNEKWEKPSAGPILKEIPLPKVIP